MIARKMLRMTDHKNLIYNTLYLVECMLLAGVQELNNILSFLFQIWNLLRGRHKLTGVEIRVTLCY